MKYGTRYVDGPPDKVDKEVGNEVGDEQGKPHIESIVNQNEDVVFLGCIDHVN